MKAIVAVDQNWGIGYKGNLLFRISADLKRFQELTIGHTIVYGRKTLETLDGRRNIMLSHDGTLRVLGAEICNGLAQAIALVNDPENTYVIGGPVCIRSPSRFAQPSVLQKFMRIIRRIVFLKTSIKIPIGFYRNSPR